MNMSLNDYIEARKIGVDGSIQNCVQTSQKQNGEQVRNNQQGNGQKFTQYGSIQGKNFKKKQQRNNQGFFQRRAHHGNNFNRNDCKNMNGFFDLRSKCGRRGMQTTPRVNQQQQLKGQRCNFSNVVNSTPIIQRSGCNGVLENQCVHHHHAGITNSQMQCGNAIQHQQLHQHPQHQLSLPMYGGTGVVPCTMLQHQQMHLSNAIAPVAMNHNHMFGCPSRSTCGGVVGGCSSPLVDAVNAISKLLGPKKVSPLCLNVQLQPSRIAEDVEEMQRP